MKLGEFDSTELAGLLAATLGDLGVTNGLVPVEADFEDDGDDEVIKDDDVDDEDIVEAAKMVGGK